jgi:hypothetical protein
MNGGNQRNGRAERNKMRKMEIRRADERFSGEMGRIGEDKKGP